MVVYIDESLFFITNLRYVHLHMYVHSLKSDTLYTSHQNNHGHPTTQEVWVFWMVGTSTSPALGYMEDVQRRDAAIINAHTAPGSVIHSDMWAAYRRVQHLPPVTVQNTVNHSRNFVDPVTGVHTKSIESYWNRVKTKLKRVKGCHAHQLVSYLDEFMWREQHGTTYSDALMKRYHS